jgi:hypothetical protein
MDYTTTSDVFAYGDVEAPSVAQTAVMGKVITAVSRRVDKICSMNFSTATYTNRKVPVRIAVDGMCTLYVNSPTITTLTGATIRIGNQPTKLPIDLTNAEVDEYAFGSKISVYGSDYGPVREVYNLKAYATYTGGWANTAAVPYEFKLAVEQLAWFTYQQRAAPMTSTAVPELGIITIPASIQPYILDVLKRYTWWWS